MTKAFILVAAAQVLTCGAAHAAPAYDQEVLSDHPVAYVPLGTNFRVNFEPDASGNGHKAVKHGGFSPLATLPNCDKATVFDGATKYLEIADHDALSVTATGILNADPD